MKKLGLFIASLLVVLSVSAKTKKLVIDGHTYEYDTKTRMCELVKCNKTASKINIQRIFIYGDRHYEVNRIAADAFKGCKYLTQITISGIESDNFDFTGCQSLRRLETGTTITEYVYEKWPVPVSMTLKSCDILHRNTLSGKLVKVTIKNPNVEIPPTRLDPCLGGASAFERLEKLEEINIIGGSYSTRYRSDKGVLYSKSDLCFVPRARTGAFEIPDGIKRIGYGAFEGSNLTTVRIPSSVKTVYEGSFSFSKINTIIVDATTPPRVLNNNEQQADKGFKVGTLIVPRGSKAAYQRAAGWKSIANIIESTSNYASAEPKQYGLTKPITISGHVYDQDNREGIIGATVSIEGVNGAKGTITDFNGYYQLTIPANAKKIKFSYYGFQTSEMNLYDGMSTKVDVLMLAK